MQKYLIFLCITFILSQNPWLPVQMHQLSHRGSPKLKSPGDLPNPGIKPRSPTLTLQVDSLPAEPSGKPENAEVGSLSLIQGIFPTQEPKQGLLHCRRILYQLSWYQGSPSLTKLSLKLSALSSPNTPKSLTPLALTDMTLLPGTCFTTFSKG